MEGVDPNVFVTLGTTDHWSTSKRSADINYDSRLLGVARASSNNNNWRSIAGSDTRNPSAGEAFVAEFTASASIAGLSVPGLVLDGSEASLYATHAGGIAGSLGYQDSGAVYCNAVLVQTGLTALTAGGRISIALYREAGGTLKARWFLAGYRNVLGHSQAFDAASWSNVFSSEVSAQTTAPDGTVTAYKLNETVDNSQHALRQNVRCEAAPYTFSFYAKAAQRSVVWCQVASGALGWMYFDLSGAGTAGGGGGGATGTIEYVGGGWYRCMMTRTMTAGTHAVDFGVGNGWGSSSYAGVVTSGAYFWGAQIEPQASASEYQAQHGTAKNGGAPVTLTDGAYRLAWSGYQSGQTGMAHPDRDDQVSFDAIAKASSLGLVMPWGAAARVADAGGYSPAALLLDIATRPAATLSLDSHNRVATNTSVPQVWASIKGNKPHKHTGGNPWRYVEFERLAGSFVMCGLYSASAALVAGNHPGQSASGWAFFWSDYDAYHNAAPTAYAGVVAANDRIGALWNASTGHVWFIHFVAATGVATVIGGGVPEFGVDATFTNATGELVPVVAVHTLNTSARIYSHEREQLGRPVYARGWDGDVLPELHFRGRIARDTELTQAVRFAAIASGADNAPPIGPLELINTDGRYDALSTFNLREQIVAVDRLWDRSPDPEARGLIDSVSLPSPGEIRIVARDSLTKLDRRVGQELFAFGKWQTADGAPLPCVPVPGYPDAFNICDTPFTSFTLTSVGQVEPDWIRGNADRVRGFVRTDAIVGRQGIRSLEVYMSERTFRPVNYDFSTWAGDNPSSWTTTNENGATAIMTQSGSAARFIRNAGAPALSISQANVATGYNLYMVRIKVSARTSGSLRVALGALSAQANITEAGTFYVLFTGAVAATNYTLLLEANDTTDLTVDEVDVHGLLNTYAPSNATRYLLEVLGGLSSNAYVLTQPTFDFSDVAYFSKSNPTTRQAFRDVLNGWLADTFQDEAGVIRFAWLNDPDQFTETSPLWLGEAAEEEMFDDLFVEDLLAPGLSDQMISGYNYNVHSEGDIAGAVTSADRVAFVREYFAARYAQPMNASPPAGTARPFHPFYAHARGAPPLPRHRYSTGTPLPSSVISDRELWRLHEFARVKRRKFKTAVSLRKVRGWRAGGFLRLKHSRYGLAAGLKVELVEVKRAAVEPIAQITMIG